MSFKIIRPCAVTAVAVALAFPLAAQAASNGVFTIYGFAQGDYTYDGNRVDPAWEDALRPTKIPTTPGTFGSNGQSSFSAKQSRFGVSGDVPINDYLGDMASSWRARPTAISWMAMSFPTRSNIGVRPA